MSFNLLLISSAFSITIDLSSFFGFICLESISLMFFSLPRLPFINPPLPVLPLLFTCFFLTLVLTFSASLQFLKSSSISNSPLSALSIKYLEQPNPIKSFLISKSFISSSNSFISSRSSHLEFLSIFFINFLSFFSNFINLPLSLLSLFII